MKALLRAVWVGMFLLMSTLAFPIRSAPAQTEIIPPVDDGRMQKWEDPELGVVCWGGCPGSLCCHKGT
jgi:hypothetical protein